MHRHEELVRTFYASFGRRDGAGMAACYHPDVRFSDPVFPDLRGERASAMWRMLCERGSDLEVALVGAAADDARGSARWEARYTFSPTGRRVLNRIDASFEFRDGLIVRHIDSFSLHRWARQALGPIGLLLGWSPIVRRTIRRSAAAALAGYQETGT